MSPPLCDNNIYRLLLPCHNIFWFSGAGAGTFDPNALNFGSASGSTGSSSSGTGGWALNVNFDDIYLNILL